MYSTLSCRIMWTGEIRHRCHCIYPGPSVVTNTDLYICNRVQFMCNNTFVDIIKDKCIMERIINVNSDIVQIYNR